VGSVVQKASLADLDSVQKQPASGDKIPRGMGKSNGAVRA
jgi:hypothetical protein